MADGPLVSAQESSLEEGDHAMDTRKQLAGLLHVLLKLGYLMHKTLGADSAITRHPSVFTTAPG